VLSKLLLLLVLVRFAWKSQIAKEIVADLDLCHHLSLGEIQNCHVMSLLDSCWFVALVVDLLQVSEEMEMELQTKNLFEESGYLEKQVPASLEGS